MTQQIELTDELKVELVDFMGKDLTVVNAARVSLNQHSDEWSEKEAGLVSFLMKNKHASPFEHCQASFLITAPIFVAREWHRHRTQSYNEVSGRYTQMLPNFYAPGYDRPLVQVGKPGAYHFEVPEDGTKHLKVLSRFRYAAQTCWNEYEEMLDDGIAKEVARMVLPLNLYTSWYATGNLRNWMGFLALRTDGQAMYEIRQLAFQTEGLLTGLFGATMAEWDKNGREHI